MLMAILGGDDAGGGVIWAPEVLLEAKKHGLILSEKGKIYDTLKGQKIPNNENNMEILKDDELKKFPEYSTYEVVPNYVARYLDLHSLSHDNPCAVIGEKGKIFDKPGFEVEFISEKSFKKDDGFYNKDIVFMPVEGYWSIKSDICDLILNPGDTFSIPKHNKYSLEPTKPGMAGMYKVIPTDDMPGSTHRKQ